MAGRPPKWMSLLNAYIDMLTLEMGYSNCHIARVRKMVCRAFEYWQCKHPKEVTEKQIRLFQQSLKGRDGGPMAGNAQKVNMSYLKGFFEYCKVSTFSYIKFRYPKNDGKYKTWLNPTQVSILQQAKLPPRTALIVHLNIDLAMRMVDIKRLRIDDIKHYPDGPGFHFHSKGKDREVPFHMRTAHLLNAWMMVRDELVASHPECNDPGNMIIIHHKGKLKSPEDWWFEEEYRKLSRQLGFYFRYHTIRRSWGRYAWELDTSPELIQNVFGHTDLKVTKDYIGINIVHMRKAIDRLYLMELEKHSDKEDEKT